MLQSSSETSKDIPAITFSTRDCVETSPKQISTQQAANVLPCHNLILEEDNQLKDKEKDISLTAIEIGIANMSLSVQNDALPQASGTMALVVEDNLTVESEIVLTTEHEEIEFIVSNKRETKDADTNTASRRNYSNDQLDELISRLTAPSNLGSPVSACSSSALSQKPNVQKISELILQKLKVLVSKDLDSIMSTTGVVGEISSLVNELNKIKDHLNLADFGTFSAVQMAVGRFKSDFPSIKLALSNYNDVQQEKQGIFGCIQELKQRRIDVDAKHKVLNQRKLQVTSRIAVLQHDLQEAQQELATILADMSTNTTSGEDIEFRIKEEYPKGANLIAKLSSIEAKYHSALAKKASLAEDWANVQTCFFPKPT